MEMRDSTVRNIRDCVDPTQLTADDFEQHIGTQFVVHPELVGIAPDGSFLRQDGLYQADGPIELELVAVTRRQPYTDESPREPFRLRFRRGHDVPLSNEMHLLSHDVLGDLALLLTPIFIASPGYSPERNPKGRFYESVIA